MHRRTFIRSGATAAAALALSRPSVLSALYHVAPQVPPDVTAVTGDGREVTIPGREIAELMARLQGRVLLRRDDAYDDARRILNPSFDRYPALIAQVTGAADIQAAVDFARDHGGLLLAVKCGGHSASGQSTCDRGMMIDLSPFRAVRVDEARQRAWVTGGSLLGLVDHETMTHGLVTPMGTVSHTGVGGLVTGGGFGRLARRFGLSIDNLRSVDVVTADGRLRHADADQNADLFWGVRGGGGNFGVVTSFEFQLHPMQREVVGGRILFPLARAREVLELYGDYAPEAPDELQLDYVMVQPPGDAEGSVGFSVCYSGPPERADAVLAPIRGLGTPVQDTLEGWDYVELQRSGDIDDPRASGQYVKGGFIYEISPELVDAIVDRFRGDEGRATILAFQQAGGAIARVSPEATAFPQRDVMANMLCFVDWPHGTDPAEHIDWIREYWAGLEPFTHGFYVNDVEDSVTVAQIQANYEQNLERLVQVKNAYDPRNLFRLNANVRPTA